MQQTRPASISTASTSRGECTTDVASKKSPDVATIRRFRQFQDLSEEAIHDIASNAAVTEVSPGQVLAKLGHKDSAALFLLEGRLSMESENGARHEIEGATASADYAVSYLQPHRYTVTAASPAVILYVARGTLDKHLHAQGSSNYEVQEVAGGAELRDSLLFHELYQGCVNDKLELPSLPDIALQVRKAMENKQADLWNVALIIDSDPAITAKLIKVANSPYYRGNSPVNTTTAAVVRLGAATTLQLVTSFAMRELFKTQSKFLQQRMERLWKHSVEIAATCFVVAGKSRYHDPETALLAGLLHDVGAIAIVTHAEKYPEIANSPDELERVIDKLHPDVGSMMLRTWGLPENLAVVPIESENWFHVSQEPPDYCAMVLFAKMLNRLQRERDPNVPPLHELPFIAGMGVGEVTPESILALGEKCKEQIAKMRALLGG